MLLGTGMRSIRADLTPEPLTYPFPAPWDKYPAAPSMDKICDWCWTKKQVALVPFNYAPLCTPHVDCPPQPVWSGDQMAMFERQLAYGPGLLEGSIAGAVGHMCAWDGQTIFDPRGYTYSRNVALNKFDFLVDGFWLGVSK